MRLVISLDLIREVTEPKLQQPEVRYAQEQPRPAAEKVRGKLWRSRPALLIIRRRNQVFKQHLRVEGPRYSRYGSHSCNAAEASEAVIDPQA